MPVAYIPTEPFTLEDTGQVCVFVGAGLIIRREDRMLGFTNLWRPPRVSADVYWYTFEQVAERARVPVKTVVARVRDRWGRADLIKRAGWERVVDAKRNGLTHKGVHRTYDGWCAFLNVSRAGLAYRLGNPAWNLSEALEMPGHPQPRTEAPEPPPGMPAGPVLTPQGGVRGVFWWKGALDTLDGHCRAHHVNAYTVRNRLSRGVPFDRAMGKQRLKRSDAGKKNPKRSSKRWDFDTHPPYLPGDTGVDVGLSPTQIYEAEQAAKAHAAANPAPRPHVVSAAEAPHTADVIDPFEGL